MATAANVKKPPPRDLVREIRLFQNDLENFITERVAILKAGRDGAGLPTAMLREQLTHGISCPCAVVLRLLGEQ
jgi:hypothetical protein